LHASLGTAEGSVAQKISCRHVFQSFHFGLGEIKKAAASSFVTKNAAADFWVGIQF